MPEIYEPAEDSYLMSETLAMELPKLLNKNPELKLLEIGVGSGINLQTTLNVGVKRDNIFGSDINKKAVSHCKKLGFHVILSDLFSNIDGKFDLIVFNPPYLPLDEKEPRKSRVATTGGLHGNELIIKFLKEARKHLNREGRIFIITSSLAQDVNFKILGYKAKEVSSVKLFFEELSLWKLDLNEEI